MAVKILEDTITFEAFIDHEDQGFEDDVCLRRTKRSFMAVRTISM